MKFEELGLSEPILRALEVLEFSDATPIQSATVPRVLAGADVIGRSVTGSGKTFAFGLPIIESLSDEDCVQGLIICPTRELAEQVTTELRKVTNSLDRVKLALLCGGMDMKRQIVNLKQAKIAVGTPGRVLDHLKRRTLKTAGIKFAVLDEADEMLKMGFEEDVRAILDAVPADRRTLMFSATMPPAAVAIASKYMRKPETVEIEGATATVETVKQGYIFCKNADKTAVITELLKAVDTDKCVVFCNTRNGVEQLADALGAARVNVRALHGQMQQSERRRAMNAARSYDGAVLVATDVAARGIDISDIEYVINYDLPHELDFYIHRVGRTARAGKAGTAVTILSTRMQQNKLREFAKEAHCEIVPMTVRGDKLVDADTSGDVWVDKIKLAAAEGDLSAVKALETQQQSEQARAKVTDAAAENMLGALRKKIVHTELLTQLRTFGYADEELLNAALTLYLDLKTETQRAKDRKGQYRGYSKSESYSKNSYAKRDGEAKSGGYAKSGGDGKGGYAKRDYAKKDYSKKDSYKKDGYSKDGNFKSRRDGDK